MSLLALKKTSRRSKEDKVFDMINIILVAIMVVLVVYPLYFIVIYDHTSKNSFLRIACLPRLVMFRPLNF